MKSVLIHGAYGGEELCDLHFSKYVEDGSIAIQLICAEGEDAGMPFATATVCIPGIIKAIHNHPQFTPHSGYRVVLIKNWSENEGILESLIDAGVVSKPFCQVPTGYVHADACYLLKDEERE